ncbi:hypothetical protein ACFVTM_03765 [Arthrobacter sp. NPDC058130]|uniref:hypothetical protein n=1 Tax=Arthrobacter sp. NPDC058130 TaxID=3346353 RepID=UPI0036EB7B01
MKIKLRATVLLGLAMTLSVSSCSSGLSSDELKSMKSSLDYKTMTIVLPLDKYTLSPREALLIDQANAIVFDGCLQRFGFSDPNAGRDWATRPVQADRTFGLWSMDYAEKFGYGIIPDPAGDAINKQFEESIPARNEAWSKCLTEVQFMPTYRSRSTPLGASRTVVEEGYRQAYDATEKDSGTKAVIKDWQACMKASGLEINEEAGFLPVYPPDDIAAQMPIAVIDVKCKEKLLFRQKIGDIEAQYQASYIGNHEAELLAHRNKANEALEKARKIVNG